MSQLVDTARNAYLRIRGFLKPPLVLLGHTAIVWSVAFLPDGKEVISGSEDGSARRWRVEDGCEVVVLEGHTGRVRSLAFSPDSARFVSGSTDKTVIVWSTTTGERLLGPLIGHTNTVWCACFSPNGDKIASCDGNHIRIWNSQSGDLVIRPIRTSAIPLAWTPDGQQLFAGCADGSIKRFALSTGSILVTWKAHTSIVHSIAVSPNGKFVASASLDKTVRLWDMKTSTQIGPTLQCDDKVLSVAISPAGSHLVSGADDGKIRIWSLKGMSPLVLLGHTGRVRSVAFLPDGKEVISGGEDGSARRWRVEDGCELGRAIREKGPVVAVASSDGNWIATGGEENNTITIWTAATRDKVVILEGHTDHVWSLAFSPDSASVVSGSKDKTVIVWSTTTGECLLGRLRGHTGPIWCACFSPNGDKIASCDSVDIRIWNSQSGDQVVLRRIASPSFVTWTPDHELIVGCKNGSIKRFSSSIVSLLATRSAHTDWVCSIAVSPNGKFMASASCDKTIRLWNMMTFTQIGPTLQCHVEVWSIAISPAGDHLVSGGRGGRVRIWSLKGMISRALLVDMPATSDAMAGANDSSSSSTLIMVSSSVG
ncbi:hypothetical protein PAXINDRAFT_82628 [Paxillus involutus ATCC 200175]|uniref:WD40 repeat-like protein n=1 Tax=Paxillus involutus ATCC 200175 TaxID=664439 RepID=A0A0C9TY58_PAXIN|nr:hypothetical protein PAXINDRAFT_82628 [Paxillus involutus ATCC 200175]